MSTSDNSSAKPGGRPVVLIADNDAGVSGLLAEVLRGEGLFPVVVGDGTRALQHLREHRVDLLVCDLDMPGMDGLEVLRHLGNEQYRPPVFVITGYLNPETEGTLGDLGFVREVLEKPFDLLAFSRKCKALLERPVSASGESR